MAWGTQWARQGPPRIELLPRQLVEERVVRRQRTGIGAAFLVLLAVLGVWYALETQALRDAQAEADRERATATTLRAQRAQLQPLADLEAQIAAAEQLRATVYRNEIRFSGVMRDISAIVPDDVWLTSMAVAFTDAANGSQTGTGAAASTGSAGATASSGAGAPPTTPGSPGAGSPVASITFAGAGSSTSTSAGSCGRWPAGPRRADSRCT